MSASNYLITGAGRGIGLGLVANLLSRPSTTVIASTRNGKPNDALAAIKPASGSRLITVAIDSRSKTDVPAAIERLQSEFGITHLDVVIANAGLADGTVKGLDVSIDVLQEDIDINTYGPVRLLLGAYPLLQKAKTPKFAVITSVVGSVAGAHLFAAFPYEYGASKAAINYLLRRFNSEFKDLVVLGLHPGLVDTDMGKPYGVSLNMPTVSVNDSATGLLKEIDGAVKTEKDTLKRWDGEDFMW